MERIKNTKILQIPDKVTETSDKLTYDLEIDLYPHTFSTKSMSLMTDFTSILVKNESHIQKDILKKNWLFFTQPLAQADQVSVKEFLNRFFNAFKNINITLRSVEVVENSNQLKATIQIGDQIILYPLLVTAKKSGEYSLKLPIPPSSVGGWHKLAAQNPEIYPDWDKFYTFNGSQNPSTKEKLIQPEIQKTENDQVVVLANIESPELTNIDTIVETEPNEIARRVEIEPQTFVMSIYNEPDFDQLMQNSDLLKQKQILEETLSIFSNYDPNVNSKYAILFGLPENLDLEDHLNDLTKYLLFLNQMPAGGEVTVDKKAKFQKLDKILNELRTILYSISLNSNQIIQSLLAPYLKSLHQIRLDIFNQEYDLAITTIRTEILLEYNLEGATKLQDLINSQLNTLDIAISDQHELHNSVQLGYGGVENPMEVDWYLFYQIQGIKNLLTDENGQDKFRLISEELKKFTAKYFSDGSESATQFANKWKIKGIDPDTVFPSTSKMRYEGRTLQEVVDSLLFQNATQKITVEELRNALIFLREFGGRQIGVDENNSKNKETTSEYVKLTAVISDFILTATRDEIQVEEQDLIDLNKILENIQKDIDAINIFRKALYFVTLDYNSENGIKIKAALLKIIFTRKYFNLIKSSTHKENHTFSNLILENAVDAKNFNIYLKDIYKTFIQVNQQNDQNSKFDFDHEKKQEYLNDPKFWAYVLEQLKYDDVNILRSLYIQFSSNAQTSTSNIDQSDTLPQTKNILVTNDKGEPEVIKIETQVDLGQQFNLLKVRRTFTHDASLGLVPASLSLGYSKLVDGVDGNFSFIPFRDIENTRSSRKSGRNSESSKSPKIIDTASNNSGDRTITVPGANLPHASFKWQTGVLLPDDVADPNHPDLPKYQKMLDQSGQTLHFNSSNHAQRFSREGSLLNPAPQNYWTVAKIKPDLELNLGTAEIIQEKTENPIDSNLSEGSAEIIESQSETPHDNIVDVSKFWERIDEVNKFQNARRMLAEDCQAKLNIPEEDKNEFYNMGLLSIFTDADNLAQSFGITDPILRTRTSDTEVNNIVEGVELINTHLSNPEESFGGFLNPVEIKVISQSKDAFHEIFLDANVYKLMINKEYDSIQSHLEKFNTHTKILLGVLKKPSTFKNIVPIVDIYKNKLKMMIDDISSVSNADAKLIQQLNYLVSCTWSKGFNIQIEKLEEMVYQIWTLILSCYCDDESQLNHLYKEYFDKGGQSWIKYVTGVLKSNKSPGDHKTSKQNLIQWMEFILTNQEIVVEWSKLRLSIYQPDLINSEMAKYFSHSLLQNKIGTFHDRLEMVEENDLDNYLQKINTELKLINVDREQVSADVMCQVLVTSFDSLQKTLKKILSKNLVYLVGYHVTKDESNGLEKRNLYKTHFKSTDLNNVKHKVMLDWCTKVLNNNVGMSVIISKALIDIIKTKQDTLDFLRIGEWLYLQVFYKGLRTAMEHAANTGDQYFICEFDTDKYEQIMQPVSARIDSLLNELNTADVDEVETQPNYVDSGNKLFVEMTPHDEQMFSKGQYLNLAVESNELIKNSYENILQRMNARDQINFNLILRQAYSISNGTPFLKKSLAVDTLLMQNNVSDATKEFFTVLCREYSDFNKLKDLYTNSNFMKVIIEASLGVYAQYSFIKELDVEINNLASVTPSTIKPSLKNRISYGLDYITRQTDPKEIFIDNLDPSKRLVQFCISLFREKLLQALADNSDRDVENQTFLCYLFDLDPHKADEVAKIQQILGEDYLQKIQNLLLPNIVLNKKPNLGQVKSLIKMLPKAKSNEWQQYWSPQITKLFASVEELQFNPEDDNVTYWSLVFDEIGISNTETKTEPEIELFSTPALDEITEEEAEITLEDLNYQVTESLLSVVSEDELFNTKIGETPLIDVLSDYIQKIDYNSFQAILLPPDFKLWEVRTLGPEIILMKFSEILLQDYGLPSLFDLTNMYSTTNRSVSLNTGEIDKSQLLIYKNILLNLLCELKLENQAISLENSELNVIKNPNQISQYTNILNQKLLQAGKEVKIGLTFDAIGINQATMENFSKKLNLIMQQFINSDESHLQTFLSDSIVQSGSHISSAIPIGMQLKFISPSELPYYTLALPQEFRNTNILRGRVNLETRFRCGFKTDDQGNQEMIVYYLGNDHDSI